MTHRLTKAIRYARSMPTIASAVMRRVANRITPIDSTNVVALGADPSGCLDSTQQIQAAISRGCGLQLPPGTFVVTESLRM